LASRFRRLGSLGLRHSDGLVAQEDALPFLHYRVTAVLSPRESVRTHFCGSPSADASEPLAIPVPTCPFQAPDCVRVYFPIPSVSRKVALRGCHSGACDHPLLPPRSRAVRSKHNEENDTAFNKVSTFPPSPSPAPEHTITHDHRSTCRRCARSSRGATIAHLSSCRRGA
jgi:hypothetical protein